MSGFINKCELICDYLNKDLLKDIMNKLALTLFVILALISQAACTQQVTVHEAPGTVISAMLSENYIYALLSLIMLIATLI